MRHCAECCWVIAVVWSLQICLNQAACDANRILKAWFLSANGLVLIEITGFYVRDAAFKDSTCIPQMRKIVCDDQCAFKRLQSSNLPSICSTDIMLAPELHLRYFSLLRGSLPFITSVSGIVTDVAELTETFEGAPMRGSTLNDTNGKYVFCDALGRHAHNVALRHENCIAVFFATAQARCDHEIRELLVHDSSFVFFLRHLVVLPAARVLR